MKSIDHAHGRRDRMSAGPGGLDVDVVVADGHVGHHPQLLPGGGDEGVVDAVVEHRHDGVGAAHRGVELVASERAIVGRDPHGGAALAQRVECRLRQGAGDDDPGHGAGLCQRGRPPLTERRLLPGIALTDRRSPPVGPAA
jgi:hypothetical protein